MILYKDILSGDEMFTDAYAIEPFMESFYKVIGKQITVRPDSIDDSAIGGNPSAEEEAEAAQDVNATSGNNIAIQNRLVEAPKYDKKSFFAYAKGYSKRVLSKLKEMGEYTKAQEFQASAPEGVTYIAKNAKDFKFYVGEGEDFDGSMGYEDWDGERPFILFFKHALIPQKV